MRPTVFPAANCTFRAPQGLDDSQVQPIAAYGANIERGSMEGASVIVTAWLPTEEDLMRLNAGLPVFLSVIGSGLPPHMLTTTFDEAIHPA